MRWLIQHIDKRFRPNVTDLAPSNALIQQPVFWLRFVARLAKKIAFDNIEWSYLRTISKCKVFCRQGTLNRRVIAYGTNPILHDPVNTGVVNDFAASNASKNAMAFLDRIRKNDKFLLFRCRCAMEVLWRQIARNTVVDSHHFVSSQIQVWIRPATVAKGLSEGITG